MRVNGFQLTPHFSLREFECSCCRTVKLSPLLTEKLEALRQFWGMPIVVNSGYRCPAHNAAVGGVSKSRHMQGKAADVRVAAVDQDDFGLLAERCGFMRVILYKAEHFVHLEI